MKLKHKVTINISDADGRASPVVKSGTTTIRRKLMKLLLGDKMNVLVVSPEDSVQTVEIHELKGGDPDETVRSETGYHVSQAIKLGDYNIGRTGQILTLPHYMTFLLTNT